MSLSKDVCILKEAVQEIKDDFQACCERLKRLEDAPAEAPRAVNSTVAALAQNLIAYIKSKQVIGAIREYRALTGCGLQEATDTIRPLVERVRS